MNLTQQQLKDLENGEPVRITIGETPCIIVREDVYQEEIDDSPWTVEEMDMLASETADLIEASEREPWGEGLKRSAGVAADIPEFDAVFEQIAQERKTAKFRESNP